MRKPFILGLGGTSRKISYSRLALDAALQFAEEAGAEVHCLDVATLGLPMYQPDWQLSDYAESALISEFVELHRRADAYIWSSPTYHGTVTGVFKNAIDFLEFLGDDPQPYLTGKAVGMIAINDSITIAHMRNISRELRAWASPSAAVFNEEDFDENGVVLNEKPLRRTKRIAHELLSFTKAMQAAKNA